MRSREPLPAAGALRHHSFEYSPMAERIPMESKAVFNNVAITSSERDPNCHASSDDNAGAPSGHANSGAIAHPSNYRNQP